MATVKYWDGDEWITIGVAGATGPAGPQGDTGEGVPAGGSFGDFLTKSGAPDYETQWTSDGQWTDFAPTLTNWSASDTTGTSYTRISDTVIYRFHAVVSSASGVLTVSLPFTADTDWRDVIMGDAVVLIDDTTSSKYHGQVNIESGGATVTFYTASAAGLNQQWSSTAPIILAAGDTIDFTLTFRRKFP